MARKQPVRPQYRTLLLVGEGETEVAFLKHVVALFVPRGGGLRVKIRCAHGKGAGHVVDKAICQKRVTDFDQVAALLDTDTDWTSTVQMRARKNHIQVLKSEPCFEAMLLRAISQPADGLAKNLKTRLSPFVHGDALNPQNYATYFGADALQAGRLEPTLNDLLCLLRV